MRGLIKNIYKMTTVCDFSRYLPSSPLTEAWGVAVTGGGKQQVAPGENYPPAGHPSDHAFRWSDGRVLGTLQMVLIESGEGEFESRVTPLRAVGPGDVLLLPPRSWHRYRPLRSTGWTEVWIELEGPVVEQLERAGTLGREARVVRPRHWKALHGTWREIQARLSGDEVSTHDPERGALGLRALALVTEQLARSEATDPASAWVRTAEQRLAADLREPPAVERLARELGVSYTHFRREFRRITGLAPHRYLARLRLMQARRMLGASSLTLESMAERLGYSSAFHLSAAFKREFGESPRAWRQRLRGSV